ncbi:hypothetical protein [Flavobacterium sp.]|uniref:hypothetical protein n=1 Tax=Flavobacterium sp. TaxID=239 RepID=UPI003D6ABF70
MQTIKMNCDCGRTHDVIRDKSAPNNAISMGCNWCPDCEDTADDYYDEWYNTNDGDDDTTPDVPDNQLMLFSIADDILQNHEIKQNIETTQL